MDWIPFSTKLANFDDSPLWGFHFDVPASVASVLIDGKDRRMLCQVAGETIHSAFMPNNGTYFVMLNKDFVKRHKLQIGQTMEIRACKDNSKYGMAVSEEFNEVLSQDTDAMGYFEALTAGKQRTLIHIVNTVKGSDGRIRKTLAIADHLKANRGVLDFKMLNEAFKLYKDF